MGCAGAGDARSEVLLLGRGGEGGRGGAARDDDEPSRSVLAFERTRAPVARGAETRRSVLARRRRADGLRTVDAVLLVPDVVLDALLLLCMVDTDLRAGQWGAAGIKQTSGGGKGAQKKGGKAGRQLGGGQGRGDGRTHTPPPTLAAGDGGTGGSGAVLGRRGLDPLADAGDAGDPESEAEVARDSVEARAAVAAAGGLAADDEAEVSRARGVVGELAVDEEAEDVEAAVLVADFLTEGDAGTAGAVLLTRLDAAAAPLGRAADAARARDADVDAVAVALFWLSVRLGIGFCVTDSVVSGAILLLLLVSSFCCAGDGDALALTRRGAVPEVVRARAVLRVRVRGVDGEVGVDVDGGAV
ncbi:hypothetical protein B0H10DRAFT_2073844, partial [Mycena sp. CBHHK59/15]